MRDKEARELCPHCVESFATAHVLERTENFFIVCDANPLTEGHILIIPHKHLSCVGEFSPEMLDEFARLYDQVHKFVETTYGSVSAFEHGKIGQTVFHAHVHILPFDGTPDMIIPEGAKHITKIDNIASVKLAYEREGQYLYFSIGDNSWLVNSSLGYPRFFRDRFANGLGNPDLSNWQATMNNAAIQEANLRTIRNVESKWHAFEKHI